MAARDNSSIHGLAHASVVVAATRTGMIAVIEALVVAVEDALVVVVVTAAAAVADPIAPNGH